MWYVISACNGTYSYVEYWVCCFLFIFHPTSRYCPKSHQVVISQKKEVPRDFIEYQILKREAKVCHLSLLMLATMCCIHIVCRYIFFVLPSPPRLSCHMFVNLQWIWGDRCPRYCTVASPYKPLIWRRPSSPLCPFHSLPPSLQMPSRYLSSHIPSKIMRLNTRAML